MGRTAEARAGKPQTRRALSTTAGALLALSGGLMLVGAAIVAGSAGADTAPYELYCPGTPVGNIALNDVVTTGTISPAAPAVGSSFQVTGYQTSVTLPAAIAEAAAALGNTAITGSAVATLDATGAGPDGFVAPTLSFDDPIPSPVPATGMQLTVPTTPTTLGPFTATGGTVTISESSSTLLYLVVSGNTLTLSCTSFPNDSVPSGITTTAPPTSAISPVIATATTSGSIPTALTGAYELYCTGSAIGSFVANDVTTSISTSPTSLTVGGSFDVTGYHVHIPFPAALVTEAAGSSTTLAAQLQGASFDGYGTAPSSVGAQVISGTTPIPSPVPTSGLAVDLSSGASSAPFQVAIPGVAVAQDANLTLETTGSSIYDCTSYPNDSLPSGATTVAPSAQSIAPVLLLATASSANPSTPYELYCPGTPVGNIALNGVSTTAAITPASPTVGEQFDVTGYQTSVSLPGEIVSAAAALGNTSITGSAAAQLDATGATPATMVTPTLSFDDPIPADPSLGMTLVIPSPAISVGPFTATATGITIAEDSQVSLTLIVSGNPLNLTCTAYADDSLPTGITTQAPTGSPISPVVAVSGGGGGTTTTTTTPSTTTTTTVPSGGNPYELYCPGTPVGTIALNDVQTTGTITPASPSPGSTFEVTDWQTTVTLPAAIVDAAAALGNTAIAGSASATIDATGATPASEAAPAITFNQPIPMPVPSTGMALVLPPVPGTIGPFTASGGAITVTEAAGVSLTLVVSGNNLTLTCTAYPNDSVASGITTSHPSHDPISPVIATATTSTTTTSTSTTSTSTTTSSTSTTTSTTAAPTTTTTAAPTTTTTSAPTTTTSSSTTTTTGSTSTSSTTTSAGGTTTIPPTTTAAPATRSGGSTVTASSGTLAFTGAGAGTRLMAAGGAGALLLGLLLLFVADAPKRLVRQLARPKGPGGRQDS